MVVPALMVVLRLDHRVLPDRHAGVDGRRGGVDDRHAVAHVVPVDAVLGVRAHVREVGAVVDAEGDGVVDHVGVGGHQRQDVGR